MPEENGDFQYYRKNGDSYESGQVSVSLGLPGEDNGALDIDLYFDGLPSGVNCETREDQILGVIAYANDALEAQMSSLYFN